MEMLQSLALDDAAKIGGILTIIDISFRIGKAIGEWLADRSMRRRRRK